MDTGMHADNREEHADPWAKTLGSRRRKGTDPELGRWWCDPCGWVHKVVLDYFFGSIFGMLYYPPSHFWNSRIQEFGYE